MLHFFHYLLANNIGRNNSLVTLVEKKHILEEANALIIIMQ
jgi:hypothetical protein